MKVLITPEAKKYLTNLITILYENEYFGFKDSAKPRWRRFVTGAHKAM